MKTILLIALGFSAFICSCNKEKISGSGSIITEERTMGNFSAVSVSGANNVFIKNGNGFKVEVKGYGNLIPYYETTLTGETLDLHYRDRIKVHNDNIVTYVTMPLIKGITISGSAKVTATGEFDSTASLDTRISGSGDINIEKAFVNNYSSVISGSGNINTTDVTADNAIINISGSGNVKLSVNKNLQVTISGSGNVYYKGQPAINLEVSGSGKVIKL